MIVEGNPDAIALRQAGFEPVVAAMGTALTEAHLRELHRLTKNLALCFDADAAGQEATLRGMELAAGQGFDIKVVSLAAGHRPGRRSGCVRRAPDDRRGLPALPRARRDRAASRTGKRAFERVREVLAPFRDSPERQDAVRLAADRLGLPVELQAGLAPAARTGRRRGLPEGARGRRPPGAGRSCRRRRAPDRSPRCSPS